MKNLLLLSTAAALLASCGFGDNEVLRATPTRDLCGDGVRANNEGCDDGNTIDGDGCSETCSVESSAPVCGNGVREVGEACDDGNPASGDGCSTRCTVESICGNGTLEAGEACDDGNIADDDGCTATCQLEATACTLVPQSGCASGQACDLQDGGGTECRAVTAQGNSSSHCDAASECRVGYTCVSDEDPANAAWCARFCNTDNDCASTGAGSRCVIGLVSSTTNTPLGVSVCSNACDVYVQTGCPSGMGCVARHASAGDFTDCRHLGTTPDGGSCASSADCQVGSDCVSVSGVKTCLAYCIVGSSSSCPSTQQCYPFSPDITINNTQYGVCQ